MYQIAKWKIIAFAIAALLAQQILIPKLAPGAVTPDLLMIVLVFFALSGGCRTGIAAGLLIGFLSDTTFGQTQCFYVIGLSVIGGLIGVISGKLFKDHPLTVLLILVGAKYTIALTWYIRYRTQGGLEPFAEIFHFIIFPQLLWTIAAAWPLLWLLKKFSLKAEL